MPPLQPPLEPMLARLERSLPTGPGLRYEPKWDGFRCLAFQEADTVTLLSRNGRPLTRCFPEVVAVVAALGDVILDGELLAPADGGSSFQALLARLHPTGRRSGPTG